MAYALHIKHPSKLITFQDWEKAISKTPGTRLESGGVQAINPKTGESISISGSPGDVAILFVKKRWLGLVKNESWEICLRYNDGEASFKATDDVENPNSPVRIAAKNLAKELGAQIVGDEGEIYQW